MNLLEIRTKLIELSGRYDLVVDTNTYADNGADFFITAGQRFLDQLLDSPKSKATKPITIGTGDTTIDLPRCRSVTHIWLEDDGNKRFLGRVPFVDFQEYYGDFSNVGEGLPKYYTIGEARDADTPAITELKKRVILIGPKSDKDYTAYVKGKFYSYELSADEEFNFWSVEYPHTLIQAGLYMMERFYRNTQGTNDHLIAIQRDVQGIDHDVVEMDLQERTNMSDSFNERRARPRRSTQIDH